MKYFAYNGSLNDPNECGSFTVLARKINEVLDKKGKLYRNDWKDDPIVLFPECLNTQQKFVHQVPVLASEYSQPPSFVINWLKAYEPQVIAISKFAKQNLVNGGYPAEKITISHLGSDSNFWRPVPVKKFDTFTFISINSSNDRSGFEVFIPEFLKFSADKKCKLIIKDGRNEKFKSWIKSLNSDKIIYVDDRLSDLMLRELICRCHASIYYDHSTSFGMLNLDIPLCGLPNLCTQGSAIQEFVPEWTQPPKLVKTKIEYLDNDILNYWSGIGLHTPPPNFYPEKTTREALDSENIVDSLQYLWDNYLEMCEKNKEFTKIIKEKYTWDAHVDRILEVLENESV